jgi:calpain-7
MFWYGNHPTKLTCRINATKVRVTVPPSDVSGMISLNISYDGSVDDIGFTVTAYSGFGMRWDGPLRVLPFVLRASGALTTKTSGGNYTLLTYMINPQYRLRVPGTTQDGPSAKTRVEISLHAPRDVPINAIITWGRGERVFECVSSFFRPRADFAHIRTRSLVQSDIIATSGAYTYGFARLCADLPRMLAHSCMIRDVDELSQKATSHLPYPPSHLRTWVISR